MRSEFVGESHLSGAHGAANAENSTPEHGPDGWGDASLRLKAEHWPEVSEGQAVRYSRRDGAEDDGWGQTGGGVHSECSRDARGHQSALPSELGPHDVSAADASPIDYTQLQGSTGSVDDRQLGSALEDAWNKSYRTAIHCERDVVAFTVDNFTWVYDATAAGGSKADNRLIGVYGRSGPQGLPRDAGRIAGFPSPQRDHTVRVHRGHAVGHQLGGPDEGWNLFPQAAEVNQGGQWRALERYCAENPGTFMFVRAVYSNDTDVPAALEYGVEDQNGRLVVEQFDNL